MVTPTIRRRRPATTSSLTSAGPVTPMSVLKPEPPHVHGDVRTLGVEYVRRHRAAGRQDVKLRGGRQAVIPQIAREIRILVAALELAAVRVEQVQRERWNVGTLERWPDCDLPPQDAIRTHAVVPVADAPDCLRAGWLGPVGRVQHDIVVPQRVNS